MRVEIFGVMESRPRASFRVQLIVLEARESKAKSLRAQLNVREYFHRGKFAGEINWRICLMRYMLTISVILRGRLD